MIKDIFSKKKGVGIEINGNPVQHTLADPETHIKKGKYGLYFLLFIFGLKSIITYYGTYKENSFHILAGIYTAIYFVPLVIVLLGAIKYNIWTKFSIISGLILASLELIDFLIAQFNNTISSNHLVYGMLIRAYVIYLLYHALKWKQKMHTKSVLEHFEQ